jgi:acetyl-CoA synthetase
MTARLPSWFAEDRWVPPPGSVEGRRLTRFMCRHGFDDLHAFLREAAADPDWFYPAAFQDLDLAWPVPFDRVRDDREGVAWSSWFVGGRTNLSWLAVDRWRHQGRGGELALLWEGEDGATRRYTFDELGDQIERAAGGLRRLGVGEGDVVALYLPMVPEAAIAFYAAARIGAIVAPAFSGYGADALAERLRLSGAKILVTADGTLRRGRRIETKATADAAADACGGVSHVVVVERLGDTRARLSDRDVPWAALVGDSATEAPVGDRATVDAELFAAQTPCLLAFTSGSTGRPKGAVHGHGTMPYRLGIELAYCFDLRPGDRLTWVTDMGWIMGPFMVTGPLVLGATAVMLEGLPDHPGPDRLWQSVERLGITHLGLSPALVRAQAAAGDQHVDGFGLESLKVIGSTGEPFTVSAWRWLHRHVGRGHRPIINYSGGTEVGCALLAGYPTVPMAECRFAGPTPGLAVDVFDDNGDSVVGEVGELVVVEPWPSMTRGFWNEPERYLDTYWSRWPDVWVHGDRAVRHPDGSWELPGRSDDLMKVAGKRVGPVEYESLAEEVDGVQAAAAVGVADAVKGEAAVVLVLPAPGHDVVGSLAATVHEHIVEGLGKAMRPAAVLVVDDLPLTRSGKVHRRAVRAWLTGGDPGDLSTLDNVGAEAAIVAAGNELAPVVDANPADANPADANPADVNPKESAT